MAELDLYLTEDELPRIAEYYSHLNSDESKDTVHAAEATWVKYHEAITPKKSAANLRMLTSDPNLEQGASPSAADAARTVATDQEVAQVCAACHGLDGIGTAPTYPDLAGQTELYLANQMKAIRDGTRNEPLMAPIVDSLSDTDIDALAAYYANLPAPSP
jgi:cytochrome c553